jgi:XTP/dITP diphosphohydrolase
MQTRLYIHYATTLYHEDMMHELIFATGNIEKFAIAEHTCKQYDITLIQKDLEIDEIQSEDPKRILMDKAKKAYALSNKPIIVSDNVWQIPGLNGFPGPYMKSIDTWFSAEDLTRLTEQLTDRRIVFTEQLCYIDSMRTKTFFAVIEGTIVQKPRGRYGKAGHKLFAMHGDGGLTMAESYDTGSGNTDRMSAQAWHEFAAWYRQKPQP